MPGRRRSAGTARRDIAAMLSRAIALIGLAAVAAACAETEVKSTGPAGAGYEPQRSALLPTEAVVVIGVSTVIGEDELDCMEQALAARTPAPTIVPHQPFRDRLYPWFEPATTPSDAEGLAQLMSRPLIFAAVREQGVRYVIALSGVSTSGSKTWGGVAGGGGGPYGIVLGGVTIDRETRLSAAILDLEQRRPVGAFEASAKGSGGAGLIILIPYVIPAPATETTTCRLLAEQIVAHLTGTEVPESPPAVSPGAD